MPTMSYATRMKVIDEAQFEIDRLEEEATSMRMMIRTIQSDLSTNRARKSMLNSVIFRTSQGLDFPDELIEEVRAVWRKIRRVDQKISKAKKAEIEQTGSNTVQ